jgi:hypothetical protein
VLILATIALATLLASFTDWLFMDVLVNRYYVDSPELWRPPGGTARIVISQVIGTAATAALVLLCLAGVRPLPAALLVWCAGALPVTLQNLQWMKLPPAVAAGHAVGWLARLLITALITRATPL